jgi:hypothetical protein
MANCLPSQGSEGPQWPTSMLGCFQGSSLGLSTCTSRVESQVGAEVLSVLVLVRKGMGGRDSSCGLL